MSPLRLRRTPVAWGVLALAGLLGCTGQVGEGGPDSSLGGGRDAGGPGDGGPVGDAGPSPDGGTTPDAGPGQDGGARALPEPGPTVISDALTTGLSYYHRNASTGDIWCLPCDGAPVILAEAAFTGDTTVDARLLQQMRYVLGNGNEPFGTGAYAANDERNVTAMFAIAKRVPRVWTQLTSAETHLVDVIMEATLVADLYMTADKTNTGGTAPLDFTGSNDSNRDYNPNYREGMIGAVLVGTEYFGGQAAVEAMAGSYDHASFTAQLQTLGLNNLYWTFSTYLRTPTSGAPSPQTVQQGITGYAMHGITLGQLLDLYVYLASDTFSAPVSCGLNGGAGIGSAGRIISGCAGLPNVGAVGEEKEFDSVDGNGPRSSASYARLGLRDDLFNQLVLVVYGDWQDTAASAAVLSKVGIGVSDFYYKATQGYEDYSEGSDHGLFNCTSTDCPLNQALWTQVLQPAHGL